MWRERVISFASAKIKICHYFYVSIITLSYYNTTNKFVVFVLLCDRYSASLIPTALYLHPSLGVLLLTTKCATNANEQITRVTVEIDSEIKITRVGAHASKGPLIILGPLSQQQSCTRGPTASVSDFYLRDYPRDR